VLTNREPELKIAFPRGDQCVSRLEELQLQAQTSDDFGVLKYGIGFGIAGQDPQFVELGDGLHANEKRNFTNMISMEKLGVDVDQVVSYRQANPDKLTSIAWVIDATGLSGTDATQLATQIGNRITTKSYQFMADVAAVGPFGRGYRRVRFIFDTSEGTPRIIYRRDMTHLGWALGKNVRQVYLANNTEQ